MLLCHLERMQIILGHSYCQQENFTHNHAVCEALGSVKLWETFWHKMADDIPIRVSKLLNIQNIHINHPDLEGCVLYELEVILNGCSKSVTYFGLPSLPPDLLDDLKNRLLMEVKNYKRDLLMEENRVSVTKLNFNKKEIYDLIINASASELQKIIVIYGHGGTGKTFLWKTIISGLRSEDKIILVVASSDIASLFLLSALMNDHSYVGKGIPPNSSCKKGASKPEIISSSIAESKLWSQFKRYRLKENMRLLQSEFNKDDQNLTHTFYSWLLDIGDRKIRDPDEADGHNTSWIDIPTRYFIPDNKDDIYKLIDFIYDQGTLQAPTIEGL
ncbi:DNA helicase [Tanacetum coccineum]